MAVFLTFNKSGSADVQGYKLYAEATPNPVTLQSPSFDLGLPEFDADGRCRIDMNTIAGIGVLDGEYNLAVTAYDEIGNESGMLTAGLEGVTLDFVAPDPPTNASVSYE